MMSELGFEISPFCVQPKLLGPQKISDRCLNCMIEDIEENVPLNFYPFLNYE
jgi:hypothetical protein